MRASTMKGTSRDGEALSMKRLAVFLDGTWNRPEDNTNVWRTKLMLAERSDDGTEQRAYYDPGVGTGWSDRVRGGLFGAGLFENVKQAYEWLVEQYSSADAAGRADEVYVFGFSRGAFTARSLTGMIA